MTFDDETKRKLMQAQPGGTEPMTLEEARRRFPKKTIVEWDEPTGPVTRMVVDVPEMTDDGAAVLVPVGFEGDGTPEFAHAESLRVVDVVALRAELADAWRRADQMHGLHSELLLTAAAALGMSLDDRRAPADTVVRRLKAMKYGALAPKPCMHEPIEIELMGQAHPVVFAFDETSKPFQPPPPQISLPIGGVQPSRHRQSYTPPWYTTQAYPSVPRHAILGCKHCHAIYVCEEPQPRKLEDATVAGASPYRQPGGPSIPPVPRPPTKSDDPDPFGGDDPNRGGT